MVMTVEDDGHNDKFSLFVLIYDILHHIYYLIYGELQFLHRKHQRLCDNSTPLVCEGIG